jgi:hypothetical protein
MKKIVALSGILLAVSFLSLAKSPRLKDEVTVTNMGKYANVELGSGTFRLKKMLGNELEQKEFSVMLYPRKGLAGFLYYKSPCKERLLLDKDGRDAVTKAYELYIKDYEEKNLDKSQKKFAECYGVARAKIEWGPFQYSSYADPKIMMGYLFVGKSPYFCIKIPSTKSTQKKGDAEIQYGGSILYFTRSQLKDFVDAISDSEIQNAISAQVLSLPEDSYEGGYEEADDESGETGENSADSENSEDYEED